MEYVSLDQTDISDANPIINSPRDLSSLTEIDATKSILNFDTLKCQLKTGARTGRKKISKFRRVLHDKQTACQSRASLIVHMVTNSPRDPRQMVFVGFVLAGVGFLLAYNCLLNAADYFRAQLCRNDLVYAISAAYVLTAVSAVTLTNALVQSVGFVTRIVFGYGVAIITVLLLAVVVVWARLVTDHVAYYWIMASSCVAAAGCAVQQSSFYGYSSLLPRRYTEALMIGESLSGVLASGFRISTYILLEQTPTIYFILCIGQMFLCLIIFHISIRSGFVQHHLQRHQPNIQTSSNKLTHSLSYHINTPNSSLSNHNVNNLMNINNEWPSKTISMEMNNPAYLPQDEPPDIESSDEDEIEECFDNDMESSDVDQSENSFSQLRKFSFNSKTNIIHNHNISQSTFDNINCFSSVKDCIKIRLQISRVLWPYMTTIFLGYLVTLTVFPGVITDIESRNWGKAFPLLVMLVFNMSDLIGKISTTFSRNSNEIYLLTFAIIRISLIPMFIFCIIPQNNPYIKGDFWVLLLTSILGLSNGYIGCLPMLQGPQLVNDNQKEISGNLMTAAYSLGLTVGVLIAIQVKYILIIPLHNFNVTVNSFANYTTKLC